VIVLDASALIELLLHTKVGARVADRISNPEIRLHTPHLADVEVAQALRRYVRSGDIEADIALGALAALRALDLERHPHEQLLSRIWELRENVTAYDATYVALAETLEATLLTCDGRLSRAPGVVAGRVQLVEISPEDMEAAAQPE
jgi:predicted nucleic acid-binding protein